MSFSRHEHAFRPIISSQTNIGIVSLVSLHKQNGVLYATVQSSSTCSRWPTTSTCFVSVFSRPATRLSLAMTTLVSQQKAPVPHLVLGSGLRSPARNFDSAYLEVMAPVCCNGHTVLASSPQATLPSEARFPIPGDDLYGILSSQHKLSSSLWNATCPGFAMTHGHFSCAVFFL